MCSIDGAWLPCSQFATIAGVIFSFVAKPTGLNPKRVRAFLTYSADSRSSASDFVVFVIVRAIGGASRVWFLDLVVTSQRDESGYNPVPDQVPADGMVAAWAPGARVVKAFNTMGYNVMAEPAFGGQAASLFLCGDDAVAKSPVATLGEEIGFEPVDCGALAAARHLEALAFLWISLAFGGHGREIAFRLLRR